MSSPTQPRMIPIFVAIHKKTLDYFIFEERRCSLADWCLGVEKGWMFRLLKVERSSLPANYHDGFDYDDNDEDENLEDEYGIYTTLEELERNNKTVGNPVFLEKQQTFCVIE